MNTMAMVANPQDPDSAVMSLTVPLNADAT